MVKEPVKTRPHVRPLPQKPGQPQKPPVQPRPPQVPKGPGRLPLIPPVGPVVVVIGCVAVVIGFSWYVNDQMNQMPDLPPLPGPKEYTNPGPAQPQPTRPDGQALIWRAIRIGSDFNWNPSSADTDGLSGTRGGAPPFWTDPVLWYFTVWGDYPNPAVHRIMGATEDALLRNRFSVDPTPTNDPWHVSIGKTMPGIVVDKRGQPSWNGTKAERREIRQRLESLFTIQVWP